MDIKKSRGWSSGLGWLIHIGADPGDTREEALRKETLVLSTSVITVLAVVWVISYWAMGLYLAAVIPLAYQVTSIVNLALFAKAGRYRFSADARWG
jgi:adenylate cyclase